MKYKIFIINLDRSVERYQHALEQLAPWPDLPIERVSAADGRQMSEAELNQYYSFSLNQQYYHKILKPGEKGCYISHIWCWQEIVAQQLDFALILEDDFVVKSNLSALLSEISQLTEKWHYIKLAMPNKAQPVMRCQPLGGGFSLVHYKKHPVSTVAQFVSLAGANLLLEKAVPFYRPVDVMLQYHFDLGIKALGISPQPFCPEHSFDSSIYTLDKADKNQRLFLMNRVSYFFQSQLFNLKTYGLKSLLTARKLTE
ncbi:glycosyltransferase family 25 protein [Rheinheimera oceanensis]|uniref:glycosyltransferase family 25 protein n=1 Tax=Rheinheimera oceanensis TaxID=2817449 RepID=UPI001BFECFB0|nr:glycosyltransferase family 25 protein [Rheinheimera oceanensis]